MQFLNELMLRLINRDEEGQTLVEYALIIALVSIFLIGSLQLLAGGIDGVFNTINGVLSAAP